MASAGQSLSKPKKKKPVKRKVAAPAAPVVESSPDFDYVMVKRVDDVETPEVSAAQQDADEAAERASSRKPRPWISGWCTGGELPHECKDGVHVNKVGEIIRRCRYVGENGSKVAPRLVYCGCECHRDPERAGQAVARIIED